MAPENFIGIPTEFDSFDAFLDQLPKASHWESVPMYKWKGFWFIPSILKNTLALSWLFAPRDDDVLLASSIKVGTTWLKALCLSIMESAGASSKDDHDCEDILTKASPHIHVPTIESMIYVNDPFDMLMKMPSPRLLHTHLPYSLLSGSIKHSNCKIVYISRNPKDTFVSLWHHSNNTVDGVLIKKSLSLEKAFEYFCDGVYIHGPFFDHVLEYYLESLKMPNKILFLRYEELKSNPIEQVKRLASFLGMPLASEKDVDAVLEKCSLERLKSLEVNKSGRNPYNGLPSSIFFRRGITGDSRNYLTPDMEEKLDAIARIKFQGTGLEVELGS